jgi:hypothetical protein
VLVAGGLPGDEELSGGGVELLVDAGGGGSELESGGGGEELEVDDGGGGGGGVELVVGSGGGGVDVEVSGGGTSLEVSGGGVGTSGVGVGTPAPSLVLFDMEKIWRFSRGKTLYGIDMSVERCTAWHDRMCCSASATADAQCSYNGIADPPTSQLQRG